MVADGAAAPGRQEAPGRTVDLSQPAVHARGFACFVPCFAAVVAPDPGLHDQCRPPAPQGDRQQGARAACGDAGTEDFPTTITTALTPRSPPPRRPRASRPRGTI